MPQKDTKTLRILEQQIAVSRKKLQTLWDARGFTDADVLAASMELDQLINRLQRLEWESDATDREPATDRPAAE